MFLGLLGGGSGWFCVGYECFWGGYQWLRVVMGYFGVFSGGYGRYWVVMSGFGLVFGWFWGGFRWLWVVRAGYE